MPLELLSVMSTKFFVHKILIIVHVGVSMNLTRRQQMLKNLKIQIIKTLALNQKVRCHFMKRGDNVSKGDNHQSDFLFSFFINKFQFFLSLE